MPVSGWRIATYTAVAMWILLMFAQMVADVWEHQAMKTVSWGTERSLSGRPTV